MLLINHLRWLLLIHLRWLLWINWLSHWILRSYWVISWRKRWRWSILLYFLMNFNYFHMFFLYNTSCSTTSNYNDNYYNQKDKSKYWSYNSSYHGTWTAWFSLWWICSLNNQYFIIFIELIIEYNHILSISAKSVWVISINRSKISIISVSSWIREWEISTNISICCSCSSRFIGRRSRVWATWIWWVLCS